MEQNSFTLRAEVVLPPHEQTALADYPHQHGFNIHNTVVNMHLVNDFKEQMKEKIDELPLHRWDKFDESTHNLHYFAEMYIVSKELLEEYEKLKANSFNQ